MRFLRFALGVALACSVATAANAATPTTPTPAQLAAIHALTAPDANSMPYEKFTSEATAQKGLFTVWRSKSGNLALELTPDQFDKDYVELSNPVNGVGIGLFSGITDLAPVRIIRFHRQDNAVTILFPQTRFLATPGSPAAETVDAGTAPTVVGVAKIITENKDTNAVVFDASAFLTDLTGVGDALSQLNGGPINPFGSYRLDPTKSYFGATKAFPDNIIIDADQTFASGRADSDALSVTPDARSLQIRVEYNIAAIPADDSYVPRIYDDRVGYFVNSHMDFDNDNSYNNQLNYIVRWNMQKSDPSRRVSPAKKPIVYYLSNTIPYKYRDTVRKALLTWNNAFERIGIIGAVVVRDQPSATEDPNFDPDDIRYNVVRWLSEIQGGFAEAQLLYNPETGEMIKAGVVIDSDLMRSGKFDYPTLVAPQLGHSALGDDDYLDNAKANYGFGIVALNDANPRKAGSYYVSEKFADEFLQSIVLHESGHDFGLRHNFMGSDAYTAKDLQSPAFTAKYGVATSVMEYSPMNLWPKGTSQGAYFQTVLGPYDYYVIHWGYAPVAGASTPQAELPTLHKWASAWSNPLYSWSSDEDVSWNNGQAVDPRNQQWDLTNDNIGWCGTQLSIAHHLVKTVDGRFPSPGAPFDDLQTAFRYSIGQYSRCTSIVSRYLGGEYISRALRGDPHAQLPLTAVPLATQKRAFGVLENYLFSADAWNFSPALLRSAVTQYRIDDWLSSMPARHDLAVEAYAANAQYAVIARLFTPVTLQRLDDVNFKYAPGSTMDLSDLFTWMQSAVYSDVTGKSIPLVRRNLQRSYEATLARIAAGGGGVQDAQSLARFELGSLHASITAALPRTSDVMTKAHLEALDADVVRALDTKSVILSGLLLR